MKMSVEELLQTTYWIVDILPRQVPKDASGRYFAVERYFLKHKSEQIRQKHINLILKLNCYMDISLDGEDHTAPSPEQIEKAMHERRVCIMLADAMIVSDPDDTYLTVYHPDECLLDLIRQLAAGEGLFVWQPPE